MQTFLESIIAQVREELRKIDDEHFTEDLIKDAQKTAKDYVNGKMPQREKQRDWAGDAQRELNRLKVHVMESAQTKNTDGVFADAHLIVFNATVAKLIAE